MRAKNVPSWSVVKLADDRVGALSHRTGSAKPWVLFANNTAAEITPTTDLEIVRLPAILAMEYIKSVSGSNPEGAQS